MALMRCEKHGLMFEASMHSGCVVCRREQGASAATTADAGSSRRGLQIAAVVLALSGVAALAAAFVMRDEPKVDALKAEVTPSPKKVKPSVRLPGVQGQYDVPNLDDVPIVEVREGAVYVDDELVQKLPVLELKIQKLDPVLSALRARRETWVKEHPHDQFEGRAAFRFDRLERAVVIKSVFQTVAYAGYPNLLFVAHKIGAPAGSVVYVPVDARVPLPPRGAYDTGIQGIRMGGTTVSGRLPPEIIQRRVRESYGGMRQCYERGLAKNPKLQGKVTVRFVIGRSGACEGTAADKEETTLPSAEVVSCVVDHFKTIKFPEPEGGIVTVVYPINFTPGE